MTTIALVVGSPRRESVHRRLALLAADLASPDITVDLGSALFTAGIAALMIALAVGFVAVRVVYRVLFHGVDGTGAVWSDGTDGLTREPLVLTGAMRGARDTAFAAKEGTEKALNAVSDAINPDRKKV